MSYMFTVVRDDSGIRLVEPVPDTLKHIPEGNFQVSGHLDATHGHVSSLSVTHTELDGKYVASATSAYGNP